MRKGILMSAMALLMLGSCCDKQQTASEGTTRESLTFPIGERIDNPAFTGEAFLLPLVMQDTVAGFPQTNSVTFAPGAHSSWHRHGEMVVMVTDGVGLYQEEGKMAQLLHKGDVVRIPAGVRHWHGATKDSWFSQIVMYDPTWQPDTVADEDNTLSDEYYNRLKTEEYSQRTKE